MYSHVVRVFVTLMVYSAAPASAVTGGPYDQGNDPLDRAVSLHDSDSLAVRSYLRRHGEDEEVGALREHTAREQALWGFTADSALPLSSAHAEFEYSVWMPPEGGEDGFADDGNRLIRLRLTDRRRHFAYGASMFAAGQAFGRNGVARQRLSAAGLPGPGEGSLLWISTRVPVIGVRPTFRRVATTNGSTDLVKEMFDVAYAPRTDWRMFLKGTAFEKRSPGQRHVSGSDWTIGGSLRVLEGLTLSPVIAGQHRAADGRLSSTATGTRLSIQTTWFDPMALHLRLERRHESAPGAAPLEATTANLKLKTPLRLRDRAPETLTLSASLGYRGFEGADAAVSSEGLSFRLRFDYRPGA